MERVARSIIDECRDWPRSAHAHHAGSSITAISSQFDLVSADLTRYEQILIVLRDLDLEMEEAMDSLPGDSACRSNPRFDAAARDVNLDDERNHLAKLAAMLQKHADLADRLQELQGEEEGVESSLDEQGRGATQPPQDLTATQTSRELVSLFRMNPQTGNGLPDISEESERGAGSTQEMGGSWGFGSELFEETPLDMPVQPSPPTDPVHDVLLPPYSHWVSQLRSQWL